jgi:hypothetical protein
VKLYTGCYGFLKLMECEIGYHMISLYDGNSIGFQWDFNGIDRHWTLCGVLPCSSTDLPKSENRSNFVGDSTKHKAKTLW